MWQNTVWWRSVTVASPECVARRGKAGNYVMGHSMDFRAGCSRCSMTNSFVINAVLIERAVSCWHLYQLISQTTQYLDSWLSDLLQSELNMKSLQSRGHVPQCPIAGDATGQGLEYLHTCVVVVIFLFCRISLFHFVCVFTLYCHVWAWHALNKGNYLLTYLHISEGGLNGKSSRSRLTDLYKYSSRCCTSYSRRIISCSHG